MLLPDPESQRLLQTPREFLDSIEDRNQRKLYAHIIAPLEPLRERIKATWNAPDGLPDLKIVKNASAEETELRDLVNTVCIAEGLIRRCISLQDISARTMKLRKIPQIFGSLSVAKTSLMWAYAHEIFHFIRRHALVEKHFGSSSQTKHALEYDADLCAVAAIYRFVRYFSTGCTEVECKRRVLAHLFWIMREEIEKDPQSNFTGTATHQHAAARLQAIVGKLAMMHNSGPADPDAALPATQSHLSDLSNQLIQLEQTFLNSVNVGELNTISPIAKFAFENLDMQFTFPLHKQWDEISRYINYFTLLRRSEVDNESSVAFFGDFSSLPHMEK